MRDGCCRAPPPVPAVRAGPGWGRSGPTPLPRSTAPASCRSGHWSLDWWIGAEDRWHLPATEASIRQTLLGGAPVTETAMRVPGGDAIHRAYAVRVGDGRDVVVVEVENRSHVPFAVALAVRPFDLVGAGGVHEVTIEPTTGGVGRDEAHAVRIDGRAGLLLPRRPNRWAASDGTDRDIVDMVTDGHAGYRAPVVSIGRRPRRGRRGAAARAHRSAAGARPDGRRRWRRPAGGAPARRRGCRLGGAGPRRSSRRPRASPGRGPGGVAPSSAARG